MLETQTCPLCGQTHTAHVDGPHERPACWRCLKQAREQAHAPQGETIRLFEPAPAQMPGQIPLSDHGRFLAAWHSGRTGHPSARNRF